MEDFEGAIPTGSGTGLSLAATAAGEPVRYGHQAAKLDYTLTQGQDTTFRFSAPITAGEPYSALDFWVYGDDSANTLVLMGGDGSGEETELLSIPLNFHGWKHQKLLNWSGAHHLSGCRITGPASASGTVYLDQFVASFPNIQDTTVPTVTMQKNSGGLRATIHDDCDGVLPKEQIHMSLDGAAYWGFNYHDGVLTTVLPQDGQAHRLTVTAQDASGNLGRGSLDLPAAPGQPALFTDTANYWGRTYVDHLKRAGITDGFPDGSFHPNDNISRAQFSVMLYRYLHLDEDKYADVVLPFADLETIPAYALPAIRALYASGVVGGSEGADGQLYFNPGSSLTRAQASAMIGRTQARGYASSNLRFTDGGQIPGYAEEFIRTMVAQGVISGYQDGSFRPNRAISRGQMAKILYNLM